MKKISYESIVVIHTKTTCSKDNESLKNKKIIELGACVLNTKTLKAGNGVNLILNPKSEITEYCTKKTGITSEDISSGVSFLECIDYLSEIYDIKNKPWASYGSFSYHVIKNQSRKENVDFPFSDRFINIKSWFPIIYTLEYEVSLRGAMKTLNLNIPTEGEEQDSLDECLNTSIILRECIRGASMPCLTKSLKKM